MKKYLWKMLIIAWSVLMTVPNFLHAQQEWHIIPELKDRTKAEQAVKDVWAVAGKVRETYSGKAAELTLEEQLATGIMDRNTILKYVAYVVSFASQLGLFIGAAMIIYAGYLYAVSVFTWGDGIGKGKTAIKNAIIGVLVIVFSYAIMRFFTALFLGT